MATASSRCPAVRPSELLRNAAGVVTINSTIGVTALYAGVPVKALGNAVFDVPGLTCQAPLDRFWDAPPPPDPDLMAAFLRALVGTTQVKGGYYERASQACAIAGFIDRLENRPYPLPRLTPDDFAARPPRLAARTVVVAGVSNGVRLGAGAGSCRSRYSHRPDRYRCGRLGTGWHRLPASRCARRNLLRLGATADAICAFLDAVDRQAPIDDLLVQVDAAVADRSGLDDTDLGAAMDVVAALAEPMRRRGRGSVVLLSGLRRAQRAHRAIAPLWRLGRRSLSTGRRCADGFAPTASQ